MLKLTKDSSDITPEEHLLECATAIFKRDGYLEASVSDIADLAAFSREGLRHYFPTKLDLATAIFDKTRSKLEATFSGIEDLPPKERIERFTQNLELYRDEVAFRAAMIGEAFADTHPLHERTSQSLESPVQFIKKTFPEIKDPYIFTDVIESALIDWLYDPSLDVAEVTYQAYLALTSETLSDPTAPDPTDSPSEDWVQLITNIQNSFVIPARLKSGLDIEEKGSVRKKDILDSTLRQFSKTGTFKGILNAVAKDLGVSRQTILHYYRNLDYLSQAALLHTYGSDTVEKYPPLTPRKTLSNLVAIAQDISESPGMSALRAALEPRAANANSKYHDFYRQRTQSMNGFHDTLFSELGKQNQIKEELNPEMQAKAFTALWDGAKARSVYRSDYSDSEQILSYINKVLRKPLTEEEIPENVRPNTVQL